MLNKDGGLQGVREEIQEVEEGGNLITGILLRRRETKKNGRY